MTTVLYWQSLRSRALASRSKGLIIIFAVGKEKGPTFETERRAFACLIVVDSFDVPS